MWHPVQVVLDNNNDDVNKNSERSHFLSTNLSVRGLGFSDDCRGKAMTLLYEVGFCVHQSSPAAFVAVGVAFIVLFANTPNTFTHKTCKTWSLGKGCRVSRVRSWCAELACGNHHGLRALFARVAWLEPGGRGVWRASSLCSTFPHYVHWFHFNRQVKWKFHESV